MAASNKVSGQIEVKGNGITFSAVGDFTMNLGIPKRNAETGSDLKVHGYNLAAQVPSLKGMIRDYSNLNVVDDILNMDEATVTLKAANGKIYSWNNAWYSGDGEIKTGDGTVQFEIQSKTASELTA